MALTEPRNTPRQDAPLLSVTASAKCWGGGLVSLLSATGLAVPSGTASSGRAVGVAERTAEVGETFDVRIGRFRFHNSADADLIEKADIGLTCYVVDDETVALTATGGRQIAGVISDVDAQGVWVTVGAGAVGPQGPQGAPG